MGRTGRGEGRDGMYALFLDDAARKLPVSERAGWDGRRERLGLAGATGCPKEVLSSSGVCSLDLIWPSKFT